MHWHLSNVSAIRKQYIDLEIIRRQEAENGKIRDCKPQWEMALVHHCCKAVHES